MLRLPPISTLFPYTTLFRSVIGVLAQQIADGGERVVRIADSVGLPEIVLRRSEEHTSELQSLAYLQCCGSHRYLLSSPTRRSSDLLSGYWRSRSPMVGNGLSASLIALACPR